MSAEAVGGRRLAFAVPPAKILVVLTRRIGDVLLATPVLGALKAAWPQSQVEVLVFSGTEGFLAGNADVQRVLTIPERPGALTHLKFATRIARRYDLALSLLPGDRPTIYAWLAGRCRAGLLVPDRKSRWKRSLLHAWVPFDGLNTHTVRMHLALLEAIGVHADAPVQPRWTPEDETHSRSLLGPLADRPYAVLHPYPKFRYKMWTEEGWRAVGEWLVQHGCAVVVTGGPDPSERVYNARIAGSIANALDLTGKLNLGAVSYVVSRAALYVGPDTAVTHAAASLGVPTVALYGPTNTVKWGPWPRGHAPDTNPWRLRGSQALGNVHLIQGAGACVPCGLEGCERHINSTSACLTELAPHRVITAISEILNERS